MSVKKPFWYKLAKDLGLKSITKNKGSGYEKGFTHHNAPIEPIIIVFNGVGRAVTLRTTRKGIMGICKKRNKKNASR
jgi:hypothetical protein